MTKIKLGIVGIGNCACSLLQGIQKAKQKDLKGLLYEKIGPYSAEDIDIVLTIDVDARKVGKDVSEAMFAKPNNTLRFVDKVPEFKVIVKKGHVLDGFPKHMLEYSEDIRFVLSEAPEEDVVKLLKETKPDILINYLPVGSEKASKFYADCCLEAGVNFINAIPVFICSTDSYIKKFEERGLLCAGDDIKSQFGATIVHRVLTSLMQKRGVKINRTYQLNTGGNTDFLNMIDRTRLESKKTSKTEAVQSVLNERIKDTNIHVGPSDFVPWQKDNKVCFLRLEGELFGGAPVNLDLRLSVEDSPNSAGVMIDAIRCMKLAQDKGLKGYLDYLSAVSFKHPKVQMDDDFAIEKLREFINE